MNDEDKDAQFYRDTESIAFAKLDDRQLALLEPLGTRRILRRGEFIFKAGQRDLGMTVILSGEIEAFESCDGSEQILATAGPRDFMGDVAMLNGTSAIASARGSADESEILEIPAAALRKALAELPGVGETIISAFIMRRERLERDGGFTGLRVVKPCTNWLPPEIECDENGFVKAGQAVADAPAWKEAGRPPGALETSCPGIFAAGDVRSGSVKRCAAAVGEGGMAVEGVHQALGTYS